jgi:hypothetical protein
MRGLVVVLAAYVAAGCARPGTSAAPAERAARATRTATLDSAQARRLCANADSVIAAGRTCELREQGARFRILP